jgi:phosphatidylserine/phosphatidylglycerophosphate/cardiolipin synthase-like enzyme
VRDAEIDQTLEATLSDLRMSRSERSALKERFGELTDANRARLRARAFELARQRLAGRDEHDLLGWLEDAVKLSLPPLELHSQTVIGEARFSPGLGCLERITQGIHETQRQLDICVFTITDDRITREILEAKRRGVEVRVISDNDKSLDRGSDIERIEAAGVAVRIDTTEHHMHHKFAIFDRSLLLTGSYNWTRSAAEFNAENIVMTNHPGLVSSFTRVFDELWVDLAQ